MHRAGEGIRICRGAAMTNTQLDPRIAELLGEVVSTLETIIALVPDVGKLSKVQWLLAQLRGGGRESER